MLRLPLLGLVLLVLALPARADQNDARLPALFERLRTTQDAAEAAAIDRQIWTIWLESGDPETDALLERGTLAMAGRLWPLARAAFDAVIERAPDFAEGWNKRATLHYLMSAYADSIRDCGRVLALEPRHYGALSGLGLIHNELDRPRAALDWFGKALAINPHMDGIRALAAELEEKLRGKPI